MSEVKTEMPSSALVETLDPKREVQREDLRLDCLRLAAQRQGARDSRGLLDIAEEYFDWVTAESAAQRAVKGEFQIAPDSIDWPTVKAAPGKRAATLSLGKKAAAAKTRVKPGNRPSRAASRN